MDGLKPQSICRTLYQSVRSQCWLLFSKMFKIHVHVGYCNFSSNCYLKFTIYYLLGSKKISNLQGFKNAMEKKIAFKHLQCIIEYNNCFSVYFLKNVHLLKEMKYFGIADK